MKMGITDFSKVYYQPDRELQKTPDDRLRFLLDEYERCCSVMTQGLEKLRQYRGKIVSTLADGTKVPGILYTLSSGDLNRNSPYLSGKAGLVSLMQLKVHLQMTQLT